MKHYHGTPISGSQVAQTQVLRGRFAFVPWKAPAALPIALEVSCGVAVDNSAFSFWTSGETPHWPDYVTWLKGFARHPRFDFAIVPDVIDGSEKDNDDLLRLWDRECWYPIKALGCPVWHLHESLGRLARLASGRWDMVALGSSGDYATPGAGDWWDRMAEAFDVLCDDDGRPTRRIHGLRMLRSDIVEAFPFYSCDSTNVAQNGLRSSLSLGVNDSAWGSEVIAGRIERVQSPGTWSRTHFQSQSELWSPNHA